MITEKDTYIKIRAKDLNGEGVLSVAAKKPVVRAEFSVTERKTGRKSHFSYAEKGKEFSEKFFIENALPWSLSSPELYDFTLRIEYTNGCETAAGTFGFRTLSAKDNQVFLNGNPIFIKGYIRGAAAHDHANLANLPEEEFYKKNISKAKQFGFNLVRFHSVVPSETFLKAADELGILVHVELRPPHDIYDNLSEMVTTGNVIVSNEYIGQTVAALYEHPSLAVYCIGNEIKKAEKERINEICRLIKRLDPTRLFTDTCAWGKIGRPYIDIDIQHMGYYFPFAKHGDMFAETDTLTVTCECAELPVSGEGENCTLRRELNFRVPLVAHEVCHYTALRDFEALRRKFAESGAPEPWWVGEELKMIESKGFADSYAEMYAASKFFQFECWKTAFEALRSSRILGGFHFLQFADTDRYENSNGVVDCFDDENYVSSGDFLKFNGDRVLLADVGSRLFYGGESAAFPIGISNWGEDGETAADLSFSLTGEQGEPYAQGGLANIDVRRKGVYRLCKITAELPAVTQPQCLRLRVKLAARGKVYCENDWKIWVYAKLPATTYAEFTSYEEGDTVITGCAEKAFSALEEGKKVCLVYRSDWTRHVRDKKMQKPAYAFRATWNRFKPVIWDRGTNFGGLCEEKLLRRYGFATGRYYDFNYSVVTEDCDKIILDDFPAEVKSLVTGIDKNVRDRFDAGCDYFNLKELMYDRTLRHFSYLFEVGVGAGKLLVCGLNLTGLDRGEPSTAAAADFIKRYIAGGDFAPAGAITVAQLKEYMQKCAEKPVKERMMTQYWELDDSPVESKQYWKESEEYLKEDIT